MSSSQYYDKNADAFYNHTMAIDVSHLYQKFLPYVPKPAKILDAGCGIGKDTKHFLHLGYEVVAFDASIEMVKKASQETNQPVLQDSFQNIHYKDEFDAIWAKAALLHTPYNELQLVLSKLHRALKKKGIFFASFKYGNTMREISDRTFFDMDEEKILPFIEDYFHVIDIWQYDDLSKVAPSPSKAWLCILCKAI